MLRSLIAFCLSRRLLVLVSFAAFLGLGMAAATTLNIEAYPDPLEHAGPEVRAL